MHILLAALAGGLFGAGLLVSGMIDTQKVQGFLDVFGAWDPTLAFVMGGALIPMALAWAVARRRKTALCGRPLPGPAERKLDRELILGAVMFGAGWGLVGLCPGPSLASLSFNGIGGGLFLLAMGLGMLGAPHLRRRLNRQPA